jgi:hypothetical protein
MTRNFGTKMLEDAYILKSMKSILVRTQIFDETIMNSHLSFLAIHEHMGCPSKGVDAIEVDVGIEQASNHSFRPAGITEIGICIYVLFDAYEMIEPGRISSLTLTAMIDGLVDTATMPYLDLMIDFNKCVRRKVGILGNVMLFEMFELGIR